MANVSKKFKNLSVLIYFYQEKRFSILKLKDCVPRDCQEFSNENFDIKSWNSERILEVLWDGDPFPARFLQFGEDRKKMDVVIDQLVEKELAIHDVPVFQTIQPMEDKKSCRQQKSACTSNEVQEHSLSPKSTAAIVKSAKKRAAEEILNAVKDIGNSDEQQFQEHSLSPESTAAIVKSSKKRAAEEILNAVKDIRNSDEQQFIQKNPFELPHCSKNRKYDDCKKCKFEKDEKKSFKKQCKKLLEEKEQQMEENKVLCRKYKAMKLKYRDLQKKIKSVDSAAKSDLVKLGVGTLVHKDKLNLCRVSSVSKFTGDLLDVVFGRDTLAKSVIKGIKSCSKPPLDPETLNDVISHVCESFKSDVTAVRAAIRQKLNHCHKLATIKD